jgi:hypothetical protein
MLYIALLLIMSGLLLFAYSVISGSLCRSVNPQPVIKPHDDSIHSIRDEDDDEWPLFRMIFRIISVNRKACGYKPEERR